MPRIILLFVSMVIAWSIKAQELMFEEILLPFRPEGAGNLYIKAAAEGAIHGIADSVAVLYGFDSGESRDRKHIQYLAVMDARGNMIAAGPIAIGSAGTQHFERIEINNGKIVLFGAKWVYADPQCCPSLQTSIEVEFRAGELIAGAQ